MPRPSTNPVSATSPSLDNPLKKQSPYSREQWRPGEVPHSSFDSVIDAHDLTYQYGEGHLAVHPPKARGKGWPPRGDQE